MEIAALTIGKAAFEAALKVIATKAAEAGTRQAITALSSIKVDFGDHLQHSFDRCSKIKTILNRDEPVDLLSIYTNLRFEKGDETNIDDYSLIEHIRTKKRAVITSFGGSGKTIFLKYFWLITFHTFQDSIPLFVELRRFNDLTSDSFSSFLFRSVIVNNSKISQPDFERALEKGSFTIILDGFDEINDDRRSTVELEILNLARRYPNLVIVVSSRPDHRFDNWQNFNNFRVMPLDKNQAVNLLQKLDFDKKIKSKFISRVKKDLYERHQSFMSSPLLATMMLLTFDQFADIPEKVYLFYDQAFDTLFAKHDATKEAYKRKSFTSLPIDTFKTALGYFCLISYYDQVHEFTDTDVRSYLNKAIKLAGIDVSSEAFLNDLKESVCILQLEGNNYVFTHRSFQEYFSAYCLINNVSDKMPEIFSRIIGRLQDNVFHMAFDMSRDLVESKYILPSLNEIIDSFDKSDLSSVFEHYVRYFKCCLIGHLISSKMKSSHSVLSSGGRIITVSDELSSDFLAATLIVYNFSEIDQIPKKIYDRSILINKFLISRKNTSLFILRLENYVDVTGSKWKERLQASFSPGVATFDDVNNSSAARFVERQIEFIRKLRVSINDRLSKRSKTIGEIFDL